MKISTLVDKVEHFRFEFDGEVLEGEYYKYRTTTPNYYKQAHGSVPDIPEDGTEEEKATAREARNKALEAVGHKAIADTIKSWNAEDDQGNPLPVSAELFDQLPAPFTEKFLEKIRELRGEVQNPTSPSSPSS